MTRILKNLVGVTAGAVAMFVVLHVGAMAQASDAPHDTAQMVAVPLPVALGNPTPPPVAADPADVSTVVKLWKSGALLGAGVLGIYLLLGFWKKLDAKHAFYISAALGGIGMLADAVLNGQTLTASAFVVAAVTIASILAKGPQTDRNPQSGRVMVEIFAMVMGICLAAWGVAACRSKTADTLGNDVKACASDKLGTQVTTLGGATDTLLGAVARIALSDSWLAELWNLVKQVGIAAVDCAAQDVIAAIKNADSPARARLGMWLDKHPQSLAWFDDEGRMRSLHVGGGKGYAQDLPCGLGGPCL